MPIKLSDLKKKSRRITLEVLGEPLAVEYRPGAITPELMSRLGDTPFVQLIPEVVSWWDLLDDDGEMLAISEETLTRDGFSEMNKAIAGAILDDIANPTMPKPPISSFG